MTLSHLEELGYEPISWAQRYNRRADEKIWT